MITYPDVKITEVEEDKLHDEKEFECHDYVELPDGRRGHITGWHEGYRMCGHGGDELGFEMRLDGEAYSRIKVFYYPPSEPDVMFNGYTQALKQIKIIRRRGRWVAPWTDEQVEAARGWRDYQEKEIHSGKGGANSHQFKCPQHHKSGDPVDLDCPKFTINRDKLKCESCGCEQNWIEDWIFNWRETYGIHSK